MTRETIRIHTRTVLDMETGQVLADESYEYSGPLELCEGEAAPPSAQDQVNGDLDRQAAALEAFNKPDAPAEGAAAGGDGKPAEGAARQPETPAAGAGDGKTADKPAEPPKAPDTADITKAPFFNEPAFQAYYKEAEQARTVTAAFGKIFEEGRYAIKDENTLKAVHEDAFLLYDIAAGKQPAGSLLDVFKKNWDEKQFKGVLQELANYAAREGVEGKKEAPNPLESRLSKLEQERETQARADEERKVREQQMKVVDSLEKEIRRLCADKGIVAADKATPEEKKAIEEHVADFIDFVSAQLGQNPDMVKQLEKGQFGEAQRIFTERFNVLAARAKMYADSQIKKFEDRNKAIPNQPRTGSGAAPSAKPQPKGSTADRAMEMWNKA